MRRRVLANDIVTYKPLEDYRDLSSIEDKSYLGEAFGIFCAITLPLLAIYIGFVAVYRHFRRKRLDAEKEARHQR